MKFPEATKLLSQAGYYLCVRAQFTEAEPLLKRALEIDERRSDTPNIAIDLDRLADLYRKQGKYHQAELLLMQALTIHEQTLGADTQMLLEVLTI